MNERVRQDGEITVEGILESEDLLMGGNNQRTMSLQLNSTVMI